jgi:hypothetical protein
MKTKKGKKKKPLEPVINNNLLLWHLEINPLLQKLIKTYEELIFKARINICKETSTRQVS